jgi:peroxiredoxin
MSAALPHHSARSVPLASSMQTSTKQPPALRTGNLVPLFTLPSTAGGTYGPGALRSKYNLVLAFVGSGPDAESYLRSLAALNSTFLAEQARVIAIVEGDLQSVQTLSNRLTLLFPLLADSDSHTTRRMLGEASHAALCVADRFGEVVYLQSASGADALPAPEVALDWLEYIGIQCPE